MDALGWYRAVGVGDDGASKESEDGCGIRVERIAWWDVESGTISSEDMFPWCVPSVCVSCVRQLGGRTGWEDNKANTRWSDFQSFPTSQQTNPRRVSSGSSDSHLSRSVYYDLAFVDGQVSFRCMLLPLWERIDYVHRRRVFPHSRPAEQGHYSPVSTSSLRGSS